MQEDQPLPQDNQEDEKPPIMGSWNALYAFVLICHAVIILLFYFITQYYS